MSVSYLIADLVVEGGGDSAFFFNRPRKIFWTLEIIQIEKEVFDAMLERMAYLHDTICSLYNRMRDKKDGDWLTLQEVCKVLNISERKVRGLQYGGRLGFVKHGKKSCYKAEDVYAIAMNR